MLTWFRNNAKIFLIVIVVIFVGMIFLNWGRGGLQNVEAEKLTVGQVNGTGLQPANYDYARQEVYENLKNQMQQMGDPDPENQLALMYNEINNTAFEILVERTLQNEYLTKLGWESVDPSMAEALLKTQLIMFGIEDVDGYLNEYKEDPNYGATLYQVLGMADRGMFNSALSLENMISNSEVEFLLGDVMTTITARYIPFRANPPMPSDEALREYYDNNTEDFVVVPGARIRYATFSIAPSEDDIDITMGMVDSLAISGGGVPDTILVTREQLTQFLGWSVNLSVGELSEPFTASSMSQPSLRACHSLELLSVSTTLEDTTGLLDTLNIVHWEVPLFPSYDTIRENFWNLETDAEEILATEFPSYNQQMIIDSGEMIIDNNSIVGAAMPQSLISFATDSIWADSIGPVFYIPQFSNGFPALMVARKLETFSGGQQTYEEVLANNSLLIEYYSNAQNDNSQILANEALNNIYANGYDLQEYADAESLTVYATQQFSPVSVRQWAVSDEAAYKGLLGCSEFANAATIATEYAVLGPFTNNGVSYLAEVISRTEPELPESPAQLAGFYLSVQNGHNGVYSSRLMAAMREDSDIQDQRVQYYSTLDSLRAQAVAAEEAME